MASKPETTFYQSIHRLLKPQQPKIYNEKMYNPLRGGTPDVWYSGYGGDLWVEYKWIPKLPKRVPVRMYKELSPLQLSWLNTRYEEGRNVRCILGTPEGCWIFRDRLWEHDLDALVIRSNKLTKYDISEFIVSEVQQC